MIKVSVPPGVAYDMLAILEIKAFKTRSPAVDDALLKFSSDMAQSIGRSLHLWIISSKEYGELLQENLKLYDLIDYLKSPERVPGQCYDLEVDSLNLARWKAKNRLQEKFFPETKEKEIKIGYENAENDQPK
jgi:hypothetical protein